MRLVIQRVAKASVTIDSELVSEIGKGLMVLVGVEEGDTPQDCLWLVNKTAAMRIFDDNEGVMNLSVKDWPFHNSRLRHPPKKETGRPTSVLPDMKRPFPSMRCIATSWKRYSARKSEEAGSEPT